MALDANVADRLVRDRCAGRHGGYSSPTPWLIAWRVWSSPWSGAVRRGPWDDRRLAMRSMSDTP